MLRFISIFLGVLIALFAFEVSAFGGRYVVEPFTNGLAVLSTWIIMLFDDNVLPGSVELDVVPLVPPVPVAGLDRAGCGDRVVAVAALGVPSESGAARR